MIRYTSIRDGVVLVESDEEYCARVHNMTRENVLKATIDSIQRKLDTMIKFLENTGRE